LKKSNQKTFDPLRPLSGHTVAAQTPRILNGQLGGHRGLKFHTGLLTDGIMALMEAGALADNFAHKSV
jgi:hypothetical protein